ncbi:rhomboid family intramembrane serine protease [Tenacibaculum tangerinum]|uniref:Rhomboid family intramembrane serine protease n=1 Tax=Tenacibaculum tangerinum TaxID=3038772 RepID=A0ABY8L995_9FLAO|nr:rhomboid family intramembrane serine protease [Tenacibaculum tangerinum]WGH76580.1 rhomboid family intramembrane serine protease [Tenacibaculum tangerinum]
MPKLTQAVKHLIIINTLFFIATYYIIDSRILIEWFSLFSTESPFFKYWQVATSMFMHGSFSHILFNMFALWMFGSTLESVWGTKKFITFYFLTGIGSAILYLLIKYIQIQYVIDDYSAEEINIVLTKGAEAIMNGKNFTDENLANLNALINTPTLGASGAISGLLMAFGVLFPNVELMLIFIPIPIKAKYFIPLLIVYELTMELAGFSWDNIAHLGHLSGMIIGYILIKYWKKINSNSVNFTFVKRFHIK